MQELIHKTHLLVNTLINMLDREKISFIELAQLDHVNTGSNTLDHMNRMLIRFVSFLLFFNRYFNTGAVNKIRGSFNSKYYEYYNKVFNGTQKINLEMVFKGGVHPVDNKRILLEYCVGALVHDIGKAPNITYYDGNEAYDPKKVRRHVFDSYNMTIRAKSFTLSEAAIGLLHHEYYGSKSGYQQTETFKEKIKKKILTNKPELYDKNFKIDWPSKYFISYSIDDVINDSTLAFFPNKVIEILDIFDSLTDTGKKYRLKQYSVFEAIKIMRNEYIEGAYLGIDPVLYNVFIDFLHISGRLIDPEEIELLKI